MQARSLRAENNVLPTAFDEKQEAAKYLQKSLMLHQKIPSKYRGSTMASLTTLVLTVLNAGKKKIKKWSSKLRLRSAKGVGEEKQWQVMSRMSSISDTTSVSKASLVTNSRVRVPPDGKLPATPPITQLQERHHDPKEVFLTPRCRPRVPPHR
ncbi:hypothetical protein HPP92_014906 [Vanilla planifolia]|uniref:Uncharacterized protein n=1 Tax=Vanilla planifolia TaxID=51239 RepID=A0A835URJ3_VANPL|nr:hypothetical protein HPP92_014906 [Vanilla planifolia]